MDNPLMWIDIAGVLLFVSISAWFFWFTNLKHPERLERVRKSCGIDEEQAKKDEKWLG